MIYLIVAVWFILGYIYFIHDFRKVQNIGIGLMLAGLLFGWVGVPLFIGRVIFNLFFKLPTYVILKKYE